MPMGNSSSVDTASCISTAYVPPENGTHAQTLTGKTDQKRSVAKYASLADQVTLNQFEEAESLLNYVTGTFSQKRSATGSYVELSLVPGSGRKIEVIADSPDRVNHIRGKLQGRGEGDKSAVNLRRFLVDCQSLLKANQQSVNHKPGIRSNACQTISGLLAMVGGFCGSVNLIGLAGTKPDAISEAYLIVTIGGTCVLHLVGSLATFKEIESKFTGFQRKSCSQKCLSIAKQAGQSIVPLLGTLPDGMLAYFGVYSRTNMRWLAISAGLSNVTAETLTFKLQLKSITSNVTNNAMNIFRDGRPEEYRKLITHVEHINCLKNGASISEINLQVQKDSLKSIDELLQSRRAMLAVKQLIKAQQQGEELTEEKVAEVLQFSGIYSRLKAMGETGLSLGIPVFIFLASAYVYASRPLLSLVKAEEGQVLNGSFSDADFCEQYNASVSMFMTILYHLVGACGGISTGILGAGFIRVLTQALKTGENLYYTSGFKACLKELKRVFTDGWPTKLVATGVAGAIAWSYRSLVLEAMEYAEELDLVANCEIEGFDTYFPTSMWLRELMKLGGFVIPFALHFDLFSNILKAVNERVCKKDVKTPGDIPEVAQFSGLGDDGSDDEYYDCSSDMPV